MKTDEELFTALAVGEINCPCESGCTKAKRDVGLHENIDEIVQCINRYAWDLLLAFKKHARNATPDNIRVLEQRSDKLPTEFKLGLHGTVERVHTIMSPYEAFGIVAKRMRIYACDSQTELQKLLAVHVWEIFEAVYTTVLERSNVKASQ